MAKRYNPTEYMYSSARIRALEIKLAGKERLRQLTDVESADAVVSQLTDLGFELVKGENGVDREATLESLLLAAHRDLASMECADAVRFLRYQYDANNIKALIKCASRSVDPSAMLSTLGYIELGAVKAAFDSKDYSAFPKNMAAAIVEAEEAFAATGDPRKIDFIIDRAYFKDMLASAGELGAEFATRLVKAKIDLVNIMITLRIMRMNLGKTARGVLSEAYIEGGNFGESFFTLALERGEEELARGIDGGDYRRISEAILEGKTLGDLEKLADDIWFGVAKEARYISFGAEIAIGYIMAIEYEVKNIRIILAGKDAGLSPDVIRERLRDCYV